MRGNGTLNGKIREGRWGRFDRECRCERCIKLTCRHLRKTAHSSLISGLWLLIFKRAKYGERFVNIIDTFRSEIHVVWLPLGHLAGYHLDTYLYIMRSHLAAYTCHDVAMCNQNSGICGLI